MIFFKTFIFSTLILSSFSNELFSQEPEKDISPKLIYTYQYQKVDDIDLAYYEAGEGDPVLLLHGIPDNSYLWRNIVPEIAKSNRAIALDLVGYGKSDIPPHQDYSIQRHYEYVKSFIDSLNLTNVTLVVTDIGSLYGLKYAIENDHNIKGIVFIEAMFMPAREWYKSLKFMQRIMFRMMQSKKRAYKMIVKKNKMPSMMLKMSVVNKPSDEIKAKYNEPYLDDIERREIMLYGAGPHTLPKKGKTKKKGDFADELNKIAASLIEINQTIPFHIIHANPGMIVRKKSIRYAKNNFENVSFFNVGKGKHYLTEDHPKAIGENISTWISGLKLNRRMITN